MRLVNPLRAFKPRANSLISRQYASSSSTALRKTALYDTHVKEGGKMVEFGDFQMPLMYKDQSISDSVNWTRSKASLFDVSISIALG